GPDRAAAGGIRRGRQGIVDSVRHGAKITGEHSRGRAGSADDISLALALALVVHEEKRLVFSVIETRDKNRPAHRSSELVPLQEVAPGSKEVARVQFLVP